MNRGWPNSIAIIGSGAVGGYYGGRLAQHATQHGREVHFLVRGDYETWLTRGLRVRSINSDFALSPRELHIYNDAAAMPKVDLVVITLKSTDNHHVAALLPPLLRDDTVILALQNGLGNEEHHATHFGKERVVGGIAFTCINRIEPGVIHHIDHGLIRVGDFAKPEITDRVSAIVEMFRASSVAAEAAANLRAARWEKLIWNIPFNGLGALLDVTTDRLIHRPQSLQLVRAIMDEVIATAAADGIVLPTDAAEQKIAITRTMGAYQTSTQIDRRLGKPMEIESMFGIPLSIARKHQIHTPHLDMLHLCLTSLQRPVNSSLATS